MPADRSMILKEALKVKPTDVHWHFIADYYDGPISGLLYFRGGIYRFCCFPEDIPDQHIYVVQELTPEELNEECRGGNKRRLRGEQNETGMLCFPQGHALRRPERSEGRRKAWP